MKLKSYHFNTLSHLAGCGSCFGWDMYSNTIRELVSYGLVRGEWFGSLEYEAIPHWLITEDGRKVLADNIPQHTPRKNDVFLGRHGGFDTYLGTTHLIGVCRSGTVELKFPIDEDAKSILLQAKGWYHYALRRSQEDKMYSEETWSKILGLYQELHDEGKIIATWQDYQ